MWLRLNNQNHAYALAVQYAVIEANPKVNWRDQIPHPRTSEISKPILISGPNILLRPLRGVKVQNLVWIDSAITDLRMHDKQK